MNIRNWREWFISRAQDDTDDLASQEDLARIESGVGHRDENFRRPEAVAPRCAKCKRTMNYDDGMYVMLTAEWRVHIHCFSDVLMRHFERGEAIDFETGNIVKVQLGED